MGKQHNQADLSASRWRHMAWVSEAILTAFDQYISACGGSRGVRAICSEADTRCQDAKVEDLSRFRFVEEQTKDRNKKLIVNRVDYGIQISAVSVYLTSEVKHEFFEKGWG